MVNIDAFKAHMAGMKAPTVPAPEPDNDESGPDKDGDGDATRPEDGMSPGDQALAAIKANDGEAFEQAVLRCMDKHKEGGY